jgi:hypothetical protein
MAKESLSKVLNDISTLGDQEQVMLVRQLRSVLNPSAQRELTDRNSKGF